MLDVSYSVHGKFRERSTNAYTQTHKYHSLLKWSISSLLSSSSAVWCPALLAGVLCYRRGDSIHPQPTPRVLLQFNVAIPSTAFGAAVTKSNCASLRREHETHRDQHSQPAPGKTSDPIIVFFLVAGNKALRSGSVVWLCCVRGFALAV